MTPTEAAQVLRDFWPAHERAVVARDVTGLRRLETGAAAVYEPGSVACGCLSVASPRQLVKTAYFVPKQTDYPAHFLVEALHESSGTWTEILVFTKATARAGWWRRTVGSPRCRDLRDSGGQSRTWMATCLRRPSSNMIGPSTSPGSSHRCGNKPRTQVECRHR